jgi:hypothetical protein
MDSLKASQAKDVPIMGRVTKIMLLPSICSVTVFSTRLIMSSSAVLDEPLDVMQTQQGVRLLAKITHQANQSKQDRSGWVPQSLCIPHFSRTSAGLWSDYFSELLLAHFKELVVSIGTPIEDRSLRTAKTKCHGAGIGDG